MADDALENLDRELACGNDREQRHDEAEAGRDAGAQPNQKVIKFGVKTADALRTAEADPGASVVLVAVVREFDKKADKSNANSATEAAARDSVIELEQAGDSAKAAVEADMGASEATRQAVQDAHLAICILKTKV